MVETESGLTVSQALLGTPSYMAPEQAAGNLKKATTATDTYSLGAILYELLTGQPPFKAASAIATIRQVLEADPVRPALLNPVVDRDLETICMKCLEKDPAHRYGSAQALAEDLERWLCFQPILARSISARERVLKWARRKPLVAALILALNLIGFAGIAGILWQSGRANEHARQATAEAHRANLEAVNAVSQSRRAGRELWNARFNEARAVRVAGGSGARIKSAGLLQQLVQAGDLTDAQRLSLREEAIAQLALVDLGYPTNWISKSLPHPLPWNASLDAYHRFGMRRLAWTTTLDAYLQPAASNRLDLHHFPSHRLLSSFFGPSASAFDQAVFSPDDQFLVAVFGNREVRVWRRDTEETVLATVCELAGGIFVSPDSRTLLMLPRHGAVLQPLGTDSAPRLLRTNAELGSIAFSPDSSEIAVVFRDAPVVEIWDAATGQTRLRFPVDFPPVVIAWDPDGTRLVFGGDRGRLEMRTLLRSAERGLAVGRAFPLRGHQGVIDRITFGPCLVTHSWDHSSILWDLVSGLPLAREQRLVAGAMSPDGGRVAVMREEPASESVATLFQRSGYATLASIGQARAAVGVWTSPDGRLGVASYEPVVTFTDGECLLWDFAKGTEIARLKGIWAQFSQDSKTLYVFDNDEKDLREASGRIQSYDVSMETLANPPPGWSQGTTVYRGTPGERVTTGQMAADGRTLVVAADRTLTFVDTLGERPPRSWARRATWSRSARMGGGSPPCIPSCPQ